MREIRKRIRKILRRLLPRMRKQLPGAAAK